VEPTQTPGSSADRGAHGFRLLNCDALRGWQLHSSLGISNWYIPALVRYRKAPMAHTYHDADFDGAAPGLPGATSELRVAACVSALSGRVRC